MQMRYTFVVLNWILSERITAVAAPLYQSIPIGNLTGYTVDIRVSPPTYLGNCHCPCIDMTWYTGRMAMREVPRQGQTQSVSSGLHRCKQEI